MGHNTKASFPERRGAFAHSKRRLSLPRWAQILVGAPSAYGRDVIIFDQQEPAECLYQVINGAVRTFSVLRGGRRHIAGFYLAGDFFGFEAGSTHALSAAAICDSKILAMKHSVLAVLADRDKDFARCLWDMTRAEIGRCQTHAALLSKTSSERVAHFLFEMAAHAPSKHKVELPMSQGDIADHLGMTNETVSRTFSKFAAIDAIARPDARHVILRNRAALARQ